MHILSPETDNCPSWIIGRERMIVENISWSISAKECCRPRRGLNPRPPGLQSDGASNWATEASWPKCNRWGMDIWLNRQGEKSTSLPHTHNLQGHEVLNLKVLNHNFSRRHLDFFFCLQRKIRLVYWYRNNLKYWDRLAFANSIDPDQMPQNVASDQGLHCLLYIQQYIRNT